MKSKPMKSNSMNSKSMESDSEAHKKRQNAFRFPKLAEAGKTLRAI